MYQSRHKFQVLHTNAAWLIFIHDVFMQMTMSPSRKEQTSIHELMIALTQTLLLILKVDSLLAFS